MTANELRIGNYFEYRIQDKFDERKDWWELSKIDPEDLSILLNNIDYDYRPIELTEEWLIKFGFQKRTKVRDSVQYYIGLNPITHDWLFDIMWLKGSDAPFYRNGFHKIKYVHQLQNLYFALTGEELKYNEL